MLRSGVQGCGPLRPPVSPQPQPSPVSPARASLARPCRRRRAHAHRHRSWRRVRPFRTSRARSKAPRSHLLAPRVRLARPGSAWRLAMRAHRASAARVAAQPPLHPPLEPSERAQRPPAPLYALASPLTLPPPLLAPDCDAREIPPLRPAAARTGARPSPAQPGPRSFAAGTRSNRRARARPCPRVTRAPLPLARARPRPRAPTAALLLPRSAPRARTVYPFAARDGAIRSFAAGSDSNRSAPARPTPRNTRASPPSVQLRDAPRRRPPPRCCCLAA